MTIPIIQVYLLAPDRNTIATVLEAELRLSYTEARVQWVTSYPNLSDPPFDLVAPGICGNTALLDCGEESYFHLPFARGVYDFEHILRVTDRNRNNSFIFGHGVSRRLTTCSLSEIVLNALFLPANNNRREGRSSSGFTIIDASLRRCRKEMLHLSQLRCTVRRTYFLSEGSRTDEPVLEVYAKGPNLDGEPFCGSNRFINSMQHALEQTYGSEHFVALGGVYTVSNVFWQHKCIRNLWEPSANMRNGICIVNIPETMITTFNSSAQVDFTDGPPQCASEEHPVICASNQEEEYLGYFCPAQTLYRVDEPP